MARVLMFDSIVPVVAFGFGSPWLLGGLALAGIPIVIHLLHRRRYVETDWAAMRFLIEATKKQSRRARLENWLLLLLRTLIVALLAVALARPYADTATGALRASLPVHRIVVIDSTLSMQFREEPLLDESAASRQSAGTRFAQAKQMVRDILQQSQRGDSWNLVRITEREPFAIIPQPTSDIDAIETELQELAATDSPADLVATLQAVLDLTHQATELPRKEVVFVTDLQATTWSGGNATTQSRIKTLIKQIGERARLSVLNVSSGDASNTCIKRFEADSPLIAVDRPVRLVSTVRNFGNSPLKNVVCELLVDDRLVDTKRVDLPAGVDVPIDWTHSFQTAGEHKLELHLQDDGLPIDNRRWLSLPARDELRVLLVDGRQSGNRREAASYYVSKALSPVGLGESSPALIRPQIISESDLPATQLSTFDVVILCNVGLMTEREATLLENYVRSGHGLIVFPGELTQTDSYNLRLYRDGNGLLPAKLTDHVTSPNRETLFGFDPGDFGHPLIKAFQGNSGAGLEATMTFEFLRLIPANDATVALRFTDGSPALVERAFGAGRVILSATSADDRWSTWAIWAPSFVPVMHEAVTFAIGEQWRQRQSLVNQPLSQLLPAREIESGSQVVRPNGATEEISIDDGEDSVRAFYANTSTAGSYMLEVGAPLNRSLLFAVNVDAIESDLTPLSQQEFQTRVFAEVDVDLRSQGDSLASSSFANVTSTISHLVRVLALCVLVGLVVEPLLAWRFAVGVSLLAGAVVIGINQTSLLSWLLTALVIAALAVLFRHRLAPLFGGGLRRFVKH